jgi:hypothetical protein
MSEQNYLSLVQLAKALNKKAQKLEKGKLGFDEVNEMLENSRDIYERLTVIRYKALLEKQELVEELNQEKTVISDKLEEVEESSFSFQFDSEDEEGMVISTNQKNLLDEIDEIGSETLIEPMNEAKESELLLEKEETSSLNESYASSQTPESLGDKLKNTKINDLKEAIALNQKFLFMNELFGGDKSKYDLVLDKINGCETLIEAKAYLSSEISTYSSWDEETEAVQQFNTLIERKFL